MDVGKLKIGLTELAQEIGKESTIINKRTTNSETPKEIFENRQGLAKKFFSKKSASDLNKKPTEIGKTKEKYSTMSSVEEIEGNWKICNQISTGQANNGKYFTPGVEQNPIKGKGSEPSTGLEDVVLAETLDLNLGQLSENEELTSYGHAADNFNGERKTSQRKLGETHLAQENKGKPTGIGKSDEKYSTASSVEENQGQRSNELQVKYPLAEVQRESKLLEQSAKSKETMGKMQ